MTTEHALQAWYQVDSQSEVFCFLPEQIPEVWDRVRRHIQRGIERGCRYSLGQIYDGLCASQFQLWTSIDDGGDIEAALVTAVQEDRTCLLLVCGGENMTEWSKWLPVVEGWAQDKGCTKLLIRGRIGWARQLGFEVRFTEMEKRL